MIRVLNSPNHKLNKKTQLEFNLSQHASPSPPPGGGGGKASPSLSRGEVRARDEELMRAIANYFNAGSVSLNRNAFVFRVVNFSELTEIILPFFINYPIQGIKYFDYLDFLKAVEIIKDKNHLTLEGLEKIQKIKNGMNSRRDLI